MSLVALATTAACRAFPPRFLLDVIPSIWYSSSVDIQSTDSTEIHPSCVLAGLES